MANLKHTNTEEDRCYQGKANYEHGESQRPKCFQYTSGRD